jgi:hypothetical protein
VAPYGTVSHGDVAELRCFGSREKKQKKKEHFPKSCKIKLTRSAEFQLATFFCDLLMKKIGNLQLASLLFIIHHV